MFQSDCLPEAELLLACPVPDEEKPPSLAVAMESTSSRKIMAGAAALAAANIPCRTPQIPVRITQESLYASIDDLDLDPTKDMYL